MTETSPAAAQLLSPRELQVVRLLAEGQTLARISGMLGISRGSVSTHSGRVYRKLGVHSAHQAVVAAAKLGLIEL